MVREVSSSEEAAPILKECLKLTGPPQAYFTAGPDSPTADFVAEASEHPVFELTAAQV